MQTFDRPLKVGKTDNYTLSMSAQYLDSELIASATATSADESILTVGAVQHDGELISAFCTGVAAGEAEIIFEWTTATRSGGERAKVKIEVL